MTVEAQGTIVMEKKITEAVGNFKQENPENTTHHQKIC
jgi:hypothetical protein